MNILAQNIVIQTHNGRLHSDECAAVALLTNYYARKNIGVSVLRSRDPSKFEESDILVDVGGVYDPELLKFDHHQPSFKEIWDSKSSTPLSAAGLIWRHFGQEIVEMYLTANSEQYDYSQNHTEDTILDLTNIIYHKLIEEIDANDNGVVLTNSESLNIPGIISAINCQDTSNDELQNENFNKAVNLIGSIFDIKFKEIIDSYFNYSKDLESVKKYDIKSAYFIVKEKIPTIFKCLNELDPKLNVKFLIFENVSKDTSNDSNHKVEYTIKARNRNDKKFHPICPIISEEELRSKVNNPDDIIFVHKGGFLAKTTTLEAAEDIIVFSMLAQLEEPDNMGVIEKYVDFSLPKTNKKLIGGAAVIGLAAVGYYMFKNNE